MNFCRTYALGLRAGTSRLAPSIGLGPSPAPEPAVGAEGGSPLVVVPLLVGGLLILGSVVLAKPKSGWTR